MKKSSALTASPAGVAILMRPPTAVGTAVPIADPVLDDTVPIVALNRRRLFSSTGSKFDPETVTAVPGVPMVGEKLVMAGTAAAVTVNASPLLALPLDVVTEIVPDVAPLGTVTVSLLTVAAVTVAAVPGSEPAPSSRWRGASRTDR